MSHPAFLFEPVVLVICCKELHSSEAECHLTCNKHHLPCASYVAFRDVELVTVIENMRSLEVTGSNFMLRCKVRCLHMHELCCGNPSVFSVLW